MIVRSSRPEIKARLTELQHLATHRNNLYKASQNFVDTTELNQKYVDDTIYIVYLLEHAYISKIELLYCCTRTLSFKHSNVNWYLEDKANGKR